MLTLAAVPQDALILGGMLIACGTALVLVLQTKRWFLRLGVIASALTVCLGLAYFGWQPFFGGRHPVDTYFGCTMLVVGTISFLAFGTIHELLAPSDHLQQATKSGICHKCGYDLRGTCTYDLRPIKNKCPECGTPIPTQPTMTGAKP